MSVIKIKNSDFDPNYLTLLDHCSEAHEEGDGESDWNYGIHAEGGFFYLLVSLDGVVTDTYKSDSLYELLSFVKVSYAISDDRWERGTFIPHSCDSDFAWWANLLHPKSCEKAEKGLDFVFDYAFRGVKYDWKTYVPAKRF